jgi:hypothetical protein
VRRPWSAYADPAHNGLLSGTICVWAVCHNADSTSCASAITSPYCLSNCRRYGFREQRGVAALDLNTGLFRHTLATMEIDHVFFFVERGGPEFARLSALGIVETYRRAHPGQGTASACFCFENMFLELLWIEAPLDALAPAIARTQLEPRSNWRKIGSCPFGIAWRAQGRLDIPTWAYTPPYLPTGVAIEVAEDSDDPRQPMLFTFPGSTAPAEWVASAKANCRALQDSPQLPI